VRTSRELRQWRRFRINFVRTSTRTQYVLTVREAAELIVAAMAALDAEQVPLRDAAGRVLAEETLAPLDLPPWDNASMDGYAVRASDVAGASYASPVILSVIGTIAAGSSAERPLAPGQTYRIMTGAPVPPGADSVIRVEDTDAGAERVLVHDARDSGRNVRPRGEDIARGAVAVGRGTMLRAAHLGVLASIGRNSVSVHRRPRVAILTTGDELVDVDRFDEVLRGERIVTSNSYTLEALVRGDGGIPIMLPPTRDDPEALRDVLSHAPAHDLLITSGGISVGEFDHTRRVLEALGGELRFWRVKIRPGAPLGFGMLRGTPWLGLPGNPVSTMVTFELFARPAIRRMQGLIRVFTRPIRVRAAERITTSPRLTHFLRAIVSPSKDGGLEARLTGPQGSGLLTSMARANALLIVPEDDALVEPGTLLDAILLGDDALLGERVDF
jgi:molybdopterin molybdotransferase